MRSRHLALLGLLVLPAFLPAPALAEIVVVTPGVTVRVGRAGVLVAPAGLPGPIVVPFPAQCPPKVVASPPPPPGVVLPAQPVPLTTPGAPPPVPPDGAPRVVIPSPVSIEGTASRAPTLTEFVTSFRPHAGTNEVVVQHPFTGTPVKFAVNLPAGSLKLRTNRRVLEFDSPSRLVIVRFFRDGTVQVRN